MCWQAVVIYLVGIPFFVFIAGKRPVSSYLKAQDMYDSGLIWTIACVWPVSIPLWILIEAVGKGSKWIDAKLLPELQPERTAVRDAQKVAQLKAKAAAWAEQIDRCSYCGKKFDGKETICNSCGGPR